jgi:uncharacterized protein
VSVRVGLVSDTHCGSAGALPRDVVGALEGADLILHAGDVTSPDVLSRLETVAPVLAVRGNCDRFHAPRARVVSLGEHTVGLVHELPRVRDAEALFDLFGAEVEAIVSGHSHRSMIEEEDGLLLVNPGSARLPRDGWISVGFLEIEQGIRAWIAQLRPAPTGD